jgi:hypothetical protein
MHSFLLLQQQSDFERNQACFSQALQAVRLEVLANRSIFKQPPT